MKKVGLFGGSFDPVHTGHIELANKVIKDLDLDELWFVLAYSQPFKESHVESFDQRLQLLKIATKDHKKLKVCDIESKLSTPSYTYNTVKSLKAKYKSYDFVWVIGDDQIEDLDKWHKIDDLLKIIDFVVVNRSNIENKYNFKTVDFSNQASSSAVRSGNFNYLSLPVVDYIYKNQLYFEHILKQRLSEKRANHIMRCVDVAMEIGQYYNVDQTDLFKAVVLHDITKELDKDVEMQIMQKYFKDKLSMHHKIYHQYTAVIIVKKDFRINDKNILKAISAHTTGDDHSLLGMLTYVADKVERGRPYDVEGYIELCKENIYQGFKVVKADAAKARKLKE